MMLALRRLATLACLLLAAQPVLAGSQTSPEIEDAHYDHKLAGGQSACGPAAPTSCIYIPIDVWAGWVEEDGADLKFKVELAQAPPSSFGAATYTFHFAVDNTTSYTAVGTVGQAAPAGDGAIGFAGVATAADLEGTILVLTVPKAAVAAVPGTILTQLDVASSATAGSSSQEGASDNAPDSGSGANYTLAPSSNATTDGNTTTTTSRPATNSTTSTPTGNATVPETTTSKMSPAGLPATLLAIALAATGSRTLRRSLGSARFHFKNL